MKANSLDIRYQSPDPSLDLLPLASTLEPDGTTVWRLPAAIGYGQVVKTHLRCGLTVSVSECSFHERYTSLVRRDRCHVLLVVPLAGTTLLDNARRTLPVELRPGSVYCYRPGSLEVVRVSAAREHNSNVVIELPESGKGADITSGLCAGLGWRPSDETPKLWTASATLAVRSSAEQLHGCALFGPARSLFCEARVLDLVVRVMCETQGPMHLTDCRSMGPESRRVFLAAEIITQDLENPPSLFTLAKRVRLSHTELNRRFRAIFGCTAFEYLRKERLRRAREMLEFGNPSLTEIAIATGFCSSSHFSRAFAKAFGVSPSRYKTSLKREGPVNLRSVRAPK